MKAAPVAPHVTEWRAESPRVPRADQVGSLTARTGSHRVAHPITGPVRLSHHVTTYFLVTRAHREGTRRDSHDHKNDVWRTSSPKYGPRKPQRQERTRGAGRGHGEKCWASNVL